MDKFLYYPIRPIYVNQPFGANQNSFYAESGLKGHPGIDFQASYGQPVYAAHDGECFPQIDSHGGNGVRLNGKDFCTIYWHLVQDNAVVKTFQMVKAGDLLGYADNTGQSTGTHLHFGLRFNNEPLTNGYDGFTDPQPYFNGQYAEYINNPPLPPPKYVFTRTLAFGMWNNDVKELQLALNKAQNAGLIIDGYFGSLTALALRKFQLAHNLVGDSIAGKLTNSVLNIL